MNYDKKLQKKFKQLKNATAELYANGCITKDLAKKIYDCQGKSEEYIRFLMDMAEETLRVKGYYFVGNSSCPHALRVNKADELIASNLNLFMRGCYKSKKGEKT